MMRVYREHCIAFLVFVLLAVCMTLPVIFRMNSSIAGSGGDPWQTMWRFESKAHAGIFGFISDVLGTGEPRLANLSVWPWMPIHLMFGQPLAYNIIWILHFVLAGYAMALLVKTVTNQTSILTSAPLLAGIMYMFMPYHVAHSLGHFGAMQLEWLPFIAVAAIHFVRSPCIRSAVILGILLTIQAWTEHHYIVWIAIFAVISALVYRKELKNFLPSYEGRRGGVESNIATPSRPAMAGRASPLSKGEKSTTIFSLIILFIILIFGIIFPFIPTIRLASTQSEALELGITQTIRFSADLFSFITPPSYHAVWGSMFYSLFGKYFTGNEAENVQYLGVSIILALLFFHRHIPVKQKRLWILTALFFGIMSLGPVLHVFGKDTHIPLPYAIIANLPVFSAIRVIARAGVMVSFATAVLFGWVVATNSHRSRISYIVGALLLTEFFMAPMPMQSAKLSPVYDEVASISGSRIIEIPSATNYTAASRSLYASLGHNKEVLGNIALERGEGPDAYKLAKSIPGIRQLLYLRTTDLKEKRNEFFTQDLAETLPDAMKYLDTNAIIIHTDSLSELQNSAVMEFLEQDSYFIKKSFEDAVLYTVDTSKIRTTDGVFLIRGDGWDNIGYDPRRNSVFGEIPDQAAFTIINTLTTPVAITLSFRIPEHSPSGIAIYDDANTTLATTTVGEDVSFVTVARPGETSLSFSATNDGTAILQNPVLQTSPVL